MQADGAIVDGGNSHDKDDARRGGELKPDKDVPAATIRASLFTRFRSRQPESYAGQLLAALRNAFGGHAVRR